MTALYDLLTYDKMLAWMESHPLPFACTTNFGERLDAAALRHRAEVLGCVDDAQALVRMLSEECAAKPGSTSTLGF